MRLIAHRPFRSVRIRSARPAMRAHTLFSTTPSRVSAAPSRPLLARYPAVVHPKLGAGVQQRRGFDARRGARVDQGKVQIRR